MRTRAAGVTPYLFISPAFLCLLAFGILPIGAAGVVSLTDLDVSGLGDLSNVHFIEMHSSSMSATIQSTVCAIIKAGWQALKHRHSVGESRPSSRQPHPNDAGRRRGIRTMAKNDSVYGNGAR